MSRSVEKESNAKDILTLPTKSKLSKSPNSSSNRLILKHFYSQRTAKDLASPGMSPVTAHSLAYLRLQPSRKLSRKQSSDSADVGSSEVPGLASVNNYQ